MNLLIILCPPGKGSRRYYPQTKAKRAPIPGASRGLQPVAALGCQRHGMKITPVRVEVLEVDEEAFVMDEVWPGMPGRNVQLDQAIARHPKRSDVVDARARVVAEVARRRHADEPFFAAERAQALGDAPVPRDPAETQPNMRQMHDPQPRLAIAQDKLCF